MPRATYYKLIGKITEPVIDYREWSKWLQRADRHVAFEVVGEMEVSTVFLGVDHEFGNGPPLLFETMVFADHLDITCLRCSTWKQAVRQHREAVKWVKDQTDASVDVAISAILAAKFRHAH